MAAQLSKAYMLAKVLTASNHEVVVYLYEGAIGHVQRAREAFKNGNRPVGSMAIERAVQILIELSGSLNYRAESHMAPRLDNIYNHLIENLTRANAAGDGPALEGCETILSILHDAWEQAAAIEAERGEKPERKPALMVSA